jgi:hypothetical protein
VCTHDILGLNAFSLERSVWGGKLTNYEINFRLALFSYQSNSLCFEINCLVCFELPQHLYCKTVFTVEAVRPWYISLTQMRRCSSFYLRGNYATVWLRFPHYLLLVVRWTARAIDFYCAASSLQQCTLTSSSRPEFACKLLEK